MNFRNHCKFFLRFISLALLSNCFAFCLIKKQQKIKASGASRQCSVHYYREPPKAPKEELPGYTCKQEVNCRGWHPLVF
jgi:hypothetical protein